MSNIPTESGAPPPPQEPVSPQDESPSRKRRIKDRLQGLWAEVRSKSEALRERTRTVSQPVVDWLKEDSRVQHAAQWVATRPDSEIHTALTYGTLFFSTYFLSDLVGFYAEQWIPDPPALSRKTVAQVMKRVLGPDEYFSVYSRNLFNSKGLIPGEGEAELEGAVAQRTTLPVTLLGTLVLKDEKRSVASVEDKTSGSQVYALQMHDTLAGKLVVQKVEASKVTFINLQNRKLEFVDIPEDVLNAGKAPKLTGLKSGGAGIDQVSPTQFSISRAEVDKNLADLNTILKQARAEQVFEKGSPAGFKFSDIVPGSIYDKLGLRNGDVIAAINGEPLSDPSKAIELLTQLKTASHLELQIKKDGGKVTNYSYDVR